MKARLSPRALLEAKRIKTWWQKNRLAAPDLFDDDMSAAIERIRSMPTLGTLYPAALGAAVRRVLLPKTSNHLYYTVNGDEVVVLSVWGAPRQRGPKV